jgi:hypothetical protein
VAEDLPVVSGTILAPLTNFVIGPRLRFDVLQFFGFHNFESGRASLNDDSAVRAYPGVLASRNMDGAPGASMDRERPPVVCL